MKYWILILAPTLMLTTSPVIRAHNLVAINGKTQDHEHDYRHQQYGKPLQQGHRVQSAGGNGMILWGSDARPEYGKSSVRRTGPIVYGHTTQPAAVPNASHSRDSAVNRYGKAVHDYGKPVRGYGKPVRGYGKPYRDK